MNRRRGRLAADGIPGRGPVVYWMHRDHRAADNWPLLYARELARQSEAGLVAAFCLDPAYPAARPEHFRFLVEGLKQTAVDLEAQGVAFALLVGDPPLELAALAARLDAAALVTDFDPLRHKRRWLAQGARAVACPVHEVDGRNVVPCFLASDKAESMARTIRPKIHRLLPEFLEEFPLLQPLPRPLPAVADGRAWEEAERAVPGLTRAKPPRFFEPGERAARRALERFLEERLTGYAKARNDPSVNGQSGLSPWLHFGMLSAQRVALAVAASPAPAEDKEAFLEELVVRRELADNFCLHRQAYDSPACYPDWAGKTLASHARDPRPYRYTRQALNAAETHDPAWNAAQREMTLTGKMHGYMRMYWGKKILEWTSGPEEAHETAVALNDASSLDGRDPNGYAGIAWCLGGVHDRPWPQRPVFGHVRSMNLAGLSRKFDVQAYIDKIAAL